MLRVSDLYSYMDFSEHFPLPNEDSEKGWAMLLLRLRDAKKLKEGVHFKRIYVDSHYRRVYDVRSTVRAICIEARSARPWRAIAYLCETYYDQFCLILTPVVPVTPDKDDKTP